MKKKLIILALILVLGIPLLCYAKNIINPLAAICAGAMMLETVGEVEAAQAIEVAVKDITATKIESLGAGKMGYSTSEVGDMVAERI